MNPSQNPKLQAALKLEGTLGKQRPGTFHIYQKRYCKFLDDGLTFAYAGSKEDFAQNKIMGQIPLKDVIDIVAEEKPKKFQLVQEGKVDKFEATSTEDKFRWVDAVTVCRDYAIYFEELSKLQMKAIDADIQFEERLDSESHNDEIRRKTTFNPLGILANTAKKVMLETALKTGVGIVKASAGAVGNVIIDSKPRSNEEFLKAKKLDEPLDHIDKNILQSRLLMGYMLKESKEATGNGIVDGFVYDSGIKDTIARRWCLLVSSKPIVFECVDLNDEETLDTGKLPFELEPEILYMYSDSCDDSKPLESIHLKDVIDIVVKKKSGEDNFYKFLLDLGDRKIILVLQNTTEMTKWVKAIQAARATVKEKIRSKLPTVKNMYWHLKVFTDMGEQKLIDKLYRDYDNLTVSTEIMRAENLKDLIKIQEKVANEFIAAVNACLAHKDKRIDIVRLYVDIFHEAILHALRTYFKSHQRVLENKDMFDIIQFLIWYRDRLKIFGDAFADKRMVQGITTLCKIVGIRILGSNMKTVKNIVLKEIEAVPETDGRGRSVTNAPNDVFRIANETFNVLSFCNAKEFGVALLETCSNTLEYFKNGLEYILNDTDLSIEQLAAFCNNTLSYMNNTKEFTKQAEVLTSLTKDTMVEHFKESSFNKEFVSLGRKAYQKIARKSLSSLKEEWERTSFLDIKLEKCIGETLDKLHQLLEKMHSNYRSKIETVCLEKIVTFYIQAFLNFADKRKFKNTDLQKIKLKFEHDVQYFKDHFSNLKPNVIENSISPIEQFQDFLTNNYGFLPDLVKGMKEQYGTTIKWSTIELLIKLRNDPLPKEEKSGFLKSCEESYKNAQKKGEKARDFNVFKHVQQNSESKEGSKFPSLASLPSFSEDESMSESMSDSMKIESTQRRKSSYSLNSEGYLDSAKDDSFSKFETNYFNLKKDLLYYYKEKSSETSQGMYKLKEMVECGPVETDNHMFFITMKTKEGETKTIRFKANSPIKRDFWVESIKEASLLPDQGAMVELNAHEIQLFKDTRTLFDNIEEMPDLDFGMAMKASKARHNDSMVTTTTTGRKRSFDLDKGSPFEGAAPRVSCVASICSIFGKPKQKTDEGDLY